MPRAIQMAGIPDVVTVECHGWRGLRTAWDAEEPEGQKAFYSGEYRQYVLRSKCGCAHWFEPYSLEEYTTDFCIEHTPPE